MMEIQTVLLTYLLETQTPLCCNQFIRKLKGDNLHRFRLQLLEALENLEREGQVTSEVVDGVRYYALTEKGKRS